MLIETGVKQGWQIPRGSDAEALDTYAGHHKVTVREAASRLASTACREARRDCTASQACQLTATIAPEAGPAGVSGAMSCNQGPEDCQAEQRVPAATQALRARVEALVANLELPGQA